MSGHTLPVPPLPDKFFAERNTTIGGSDIAALAGFKAFGSKHRIYARLIGEDMPVEPSDRMIAGQYLELTIAQMFVDAMAFRYNEKIRLLTRDESGCPLFYKNSEFMWWGSHPDALVYREGEDTPYAVAQIKNIAADQAWQWGESGTDQAPESYLLQVHHEIGSIAEYHIESGYLVALIGGNDLRIYPVQRNEHILASIGDIGQQFIVCHVEPQIPPEIDASEDCTELLSMLRSNRDVEISATPEIDALAVEFKAAVEDLKAAEGVHDLLKNKIIAAMNAAGEATVVNGNGYKFSYRKTKPGTKIDYPAVVLEAGVSPDIIEKHTTKTDGYYRFNKTFKKEK